ncbi:MAG: pyrimidine reductase [Gammaproteobacteria bacterium]|nr:MAG: pyrimidine reductase [Gammaproteobacteria bacterium]
MAGGIHPLFPQSGAPIALEGAYLGSLPAKDGPYFYANFVSSLDGRIALGVPHRQTHQVPATLANPRDWRLYQELGAQADLLLTSGRYFRQFAAGEAQDTLPIGPEPEFADLRAWRARQGLRPQPDIAILSASLDLPETALLHYLGRGRRLHLFTGADTPKEKRNRLEALGVEVHCAGPGHMAEGPHLAEGLVRLGYHRVYVIAGPFVCYTLVRAGILDRLYLTLAHRLLAGEDFDTLAYGPALAPPPNLHLVSLFYDPEAPAGAGQLLAAYDLEYPPP